MQFNYEIDERDHTSAQLLYRKLSRDRRQLQSSAIWVLTGVFFILVARTDDVTRWSTVLLALVGAFCIFCGFIGIFPILLSARTLHRAYPQCRLAGKKYQAEVNESGLDVQGDLLGWTARWAGVRPKGENGSVFIFCAGGRIFIFPKKFLAEPQQEELRKLGGLL